MIRASVSYLLLLFLSSSAWGVEITLVSAKDNTLFQDGTGSLSNGAGSYFFTGRTAQASTVSGRRGLLFFDVSSHIPPGATISSVTLSLYMSQTIAGPQSTTLHPLLADWGESTSDALGAEGPGILPEVGDATWIHTFYPDETWSTPGGDFVAPASASTSVGGTGTYTWSSPQMVTDVLGWINDPDSNYGWLVRGNESTSTTAKRFNTRESTTPSLRPMLTVEYDVPGSASFDRGDCNEDSGVDIADGIEVLEFVFGGSVVLECSDACDCNDDGEIDIADAIYVLSALFVPGAPLPAPPFTSCGFDPTIDGLDCTQFAACP